MAGNTPKPHPNILLCVSEASRAAHRERDAAAAAYGQRRFTLATNSSTRKKDWYSLKERGIIHLHKSGILRYVGASPQGMAVYEYGEGGMSCFHSTLHPDGADRTIIEDHPEALFVAAKGKKAGISEKRIKVTLEALSTDTEGYSRSAAPRVERAEPTCYRCGGVGHIARHCSGNYPNAYEDDFQDYDPWDIDPWDVFDVA